MSDDPPESGSKPPPSMNELIRAASGMTAAERQARYSKASAYADPEPGTSGDIPQGSTSPGETRDRATGRYASPSMDDLIRRGARRGSPDPVAAPGPARDYGSFHRLPETTPDPGAVDFGGGQRGTSAARVPSPTFNDVIREGVRLAESIQPTPRVVRR